MCLGFLALLGSLRAALSRVRFCVGWGSLSLPALPGSMYGYEWARRKTSSRYFVPSAGRGTLPREGGLESTVWHVVTRGFQ